MKMEHLQDLALHTLRDIYDAEHQITQALPKMMRAAHSQQLKDGFEQHLRQTEEQIRMLEQVFQMMGKRPERKTCVGMQGVIKEGDELLQEGGDPEVLDAGLIAAAQKVEHYEIASYGTARTYAQILNMPDAANIFQQILDQEKMTDELLNRMAERINVRATT